MLSEPVVPLGLRRGDPSSPSKARAGPRFTSNQTWPLGVGLLVERRYLSQPEPRGLLSALRARGHSVAVIDDQVSVREMERRCDELQIVVARGRSPSLLSLLARAEDSGIPVVNTARAIADVRDKGRMARVLDMEAIPTPRTYVGPVNELIVRVDASDFPLLVKPLLGDNARGIRLVASRAEFSRLRWSEPLACAQRCLPSDGYDLKLYGICEEVRAVRKRSPLGANGAAAASQKVPAREVPITDELKELALRCARALDLDLYGVDCLPTPDGIVVIEVNDFPNYSGVAGADERLANFVQRRCLERSK